LSATRDPDTEELVRRAAEGETAAVSRLLERHRRRLRSMVRVRMDPRLAARLDPSDVVQDVFAEAVRRLPSFLKQRPLPFFAWIRRICWRRLLDLRRRHIVAQHRAVRREVSIFQVDGKSALRLARQLHTRAGDPHSQIARAELRLRVQHAIASLPPAFREVLVLRHLEHVPFDEIATVLGIALGTVKSRHFRALERLRQLLEGDDPRGAR
jgi:RNA polymerase sigma-70 factor (ECF subfamily)